MAKKPTKQAAKTAAPAVKETAATQDTFDAIESLIDAANNDASAVAVAGIICGDDAQAIREKLRAVVLSRLGDTASD